MGKLAVLWGELKGMSSTDPRRADVQKQINGIERWMIDNGYKEGTVTSWTEYTGSSKSTGYPHDTGYIWYDDLSKLGL